MNFVKYGKTLLAKTSCDNTTFYPISKDAYIVRWNVAAIQAAQKRIPPDTGYIYIVILKPPSSGEHLLPE
jgi:hypothetical protein